MPSMSDPMPSFPIAALTVQPWPDPVIDAVGHEVRSPYVERFWLGLLGPSSTWLLRRLVGRARRGARRLRAGPGPHRHRARARRAVGAALAVPPFHRPVLPVRRRPPESTTRPCGCGASCHPSHASRWPASRPRCSRPTRPGRIRPPPGSRSHELRERARGPRALTPGAGRGHRGHRTPAPRLAPAPGHRPRRRRLGGRAPHRHPARSRPATSRPRPRRRCRHRWPNQTGVLTAALWNHTMSAPTSASRSTRRGV